MDLSLTDEQSMLADSVSRFIENEYPFEERQRIAGSERGFSTTIWKKFAELGWTAVPFAEEDGGLGGGAVELMLLMQAFGRGLIVEPFIPTIVLAGGALKRAGTPEQKERWLSPLIAGDLQAALAFAEPQARFNPCDIATTAVPSGRGYVINGRKSVVLNAGNADVIVVPARSGGGQCDLGGITLFAVPTDTPGLRRRDYPTVDGHRAAEVVLEDVGVPGDALLGAVGEGGRVLLETIDEATLAVCAEAFGIVCALQEKTVEYTKNRVQFGVPISSFQALQHRMVDMLIAREQLHSLLTWAVMLAAGDPSEAGRAISALKYHVGTAGRHVAQEAVQLHGGMGVTWELDVSHYFKRLSTIEILFGNADYHLDRFCRLGAAT
jgi:alkylation response protein AidB-like acyl-CoA dehydrogenase